ncbi:MAG: protein-glutamate O-methyltransferase CheR [Mucilaginibacter polytrichastri]|nr:protein-glutamate O-methyltransferase CheR [Mucilaginibacter polytrichastri]
MDPLKQAISLSETELDEILACVHNLYGFDLQAYRRASLSRRVNRIMQVHGFGFYDLRHELLNNPKFFNTFLEEITVNVTEMFRDPQFYPALAEKVLPYLGTYPFIRCWSAGCSTGEEVFSLAIFLQEHGLYNRSFIYGTDINSSVVAKAKSAIFPADTIRFYADNYRKSGLQKSLLDYFTVSYQAATIRNELKSNVLFSQHNLADGGVFNEFQLILCRNVFIYFEPELQRRVTDLFYRSLCPHGFLCLGSREILDPSDMRKRFRLIDAASQIYQKVA